MRQFLSIMKPSSQQTILDVGGTHDLWVQIGYNGQIVFLSLEDPELYRVRHTIITGCSYIQGDRRCIDFPENSFDIVFSNSVIEHVGGWEKQKAFAHETSRVEKRYWIQIPNKNFLIEPHFNFPLFQFLPLSTRVRVAAYWPFFFPKAPQYEMTKDLEDIVRSIRLLTIWRNAGFVPRW